MSTIGKHWKWSEESKLNFRPVSTLGKHWKWSNESKINRSISYRGRHFSIDTEYKKGNTLRLGTKLSREGRNKLSVAHKGILSHRKNKSLIEEYGLERAEEIREKLSKSHTGKKLDEASNWLDGRTFKEYPSEFDDLLRNKIRIRDEICKLCGIKGRLYVHHIDYDKKNNSEDNLISLCVSCHMKTNFNRDFWKYLFKSFISYWYADIGI